MLSIVMGAAITCSLITVCVSLPLICYGCCKRKVEKPEKTEQIKKEEDKVAIANSSRLENPAVPFEITAKSDRAEWANAQNVRKPIKKSNESRESAKPEVKSLCQLDMSTAKQAQCSVQKTSSNAPKITTKSPSLEKTQEESLKVQSTVKEPFTLEALSFLNTLTRSTERRGKEEKESVEDETINDAPSLAKVDISKCSEELESLQIKRSISKQASERTHSVKLTDEFKLYPLQKTVGGQRLDEDEKTTSVQVKKSIPSAKLK